MMCWTTHGLHHQSANSWLSIRSELVTYNHFHRRIGTYKHKLAGTKLVMYPNIYTQAQNISPCQVLWWWQRSSLLTFACTRSSATQLLSGFWIRQHFVMLAAAVQDTTKNCHESNLAFRKLQQNLAAPKIIRLYAALRKLCMLDVSVAYL